VGERAARLLPGIVDAVRDRCGPFTPLALFLGGSAVHGELCGITDPSGRRHTLSDLDLGVLTRARVPSEAISRISQEIRGLADDGPAARLGFYCQEDLTLQHPTLGLVETARIGFILSGEPSFVSRMQMPPPERIPRREGGRLLANRALEWIVASQQRRDSPIGFVYAAAKLHADAAAVYLLAGGSYRGGGYADRLAQIGGIDLAPSECARIAEWTSWRLEPQWDHLPLGGDIGGASSSKELDRSVEEATRSVVRTIAGGDSAAAFLRPNRIGGRSWARSWKRWVRTGGSPLRRARPHELLRTPRVLLWEAAIEHAAGRWDRSAEVLRRLVGGDRQGAGETAREIVRLGGLMDREGIE